VEVKQEHFSYYRDAGDYENAISLEEKRRGLFGIGEPL
jgi:hypothetical protein